MIFINKLMVDFLSLTCQEDDDNAYVPEASDDDVVDSDFDIDENDEPVEDGEAEDQDKTKRTRRVVTKAYKEPKREKPQRSKARSRGRKRPLPISDVDGEEIIRSMDSITAVDFGKKSVRTSTKMKTEETALRLKIASEEKGTRKKRPNKENWRKFTQEELLEEAKITEQINLASLEKYQKLELEKAKKNKVVKEVARGPRIVYRSLSMPHLESEEDANDPNHEKRCARDFVTFTDEETFNSFFPPSKPPIPTKPAICRVSNLRARYFDPVTQLPFVSMHTFRALREAYCQQLELLGDTRQPEVAEWIAWRKKQSTTQA
ncbi:vacuolar protein sorting-associated protein YL-1 isoform X2 [Brevipalpus obovatus]|uniref:vacuolar protein sorting-associated protein YL-1 isoform X2 n=1 Tax=Brevipalpus obovatus TaxID=246614 RepID=UPI003D9EF14D